MLCRFLPKFGRYIHIVCGAKIQARFNARIFASLQFKNIFVGFDDIDFKELMVVDKNGETSDENEAAIAERFNGQLS